MMSIELSFHLDESPGFPDGYWYAAAKDSDGDTVYDASGSTPINALYLLVKDLLAALHEGRKG